MTDYHVTDTVIIILSSFFVFPIYKSTVVLSIIRAEQWCTGWAESVLVYKPAGLRLIYLVSGSAAKAKLSQHPYGAKVVPELSLHRFTAKAAGTIESFHMFSVWGHPNNQEGNPWPRGSVCTELPRNVSNLNIDHINRVTWLDQTSGQALECLEITHPGDTSSVD